MDKFVTFRLPRRWIKVGLVVLVVGAMLAPLTAGASHTFTDVIDTNTHHANITWLSDAGVTTGCNPPANDKFCPSDPVKRAQMATFMRRLAENQVVDAGKLEGKTADDLAVLAWGDTDSNVAGTTVAGSGRIEVNSISITVPTAGMLIISGTTFVNSNEAAGGTSFVLNPKLDGADAHISGWGGSFWAAAGGAGTAEAIELSYTLPVAVTAGAHTVSQEVGPFAGTADFFYNHHNLSVLFIPGGTVTSSPTGSPLGGSPMGN